jgi:hypothetical protein
MIDVGRSKTKAFWRTRTVFLVVSVPVRHVDRETRACKVGGKTVEADGVRDLSEDFDGLGEAGRGSDKLESCWRKRKHSARLC